MIWLKVRVQVTETWDSDPRSLDVGAPHSAITLTVARLVATSN